MAILIVNSVYPLRNEAFAWHVRRPPQESARMTSQQDYSISGAGLPECASVSWLVGAGHRESAGD